MYHINIFDVLTSHLSENLSVRNISLERCTVHEIILYYRTLTTHYYFDQLDLFIIDYHCSFN